MNSSAAAAGPDSYQAPLYAGWPDRPRRVFPDGACQGMALASDFDGTIFFLHRTPQVSCADQQAVAGFREEGGLYGACTGRPYYGILAAAGKQISFDFFIVSSGAQILDGRGRILQETCIESGVVAEITAVYKVTAQMVIQANGYVYSYHPMNSFQKAIHSLSDIPGGRFHCVSFYTGTEAEAVRLAEEIERRWGEHVQAYPNVFTVDVARRGCSKGTAVRFLKEALGLRLMGGIGDSFNDIPLLESADRSFTFPYAPSSAKQKACVVESTAAAIRKLREAL